jgi:hypothetical protein
LELRVLTTDPVADSVAAAAATAALSSNSKVKVATDDDAKSEVAVASAVEGACTRNTATGVSTAAGDDRAATSSNAVSTTDRAAVAVATAAPVGSRCSSVLPLALAVADAATAAEPTGCSYKAVIAYSTPNRAAPVAVAEMCRCGGRLDSWAVAEVAARANNATRPLCNSVLDDTTAAGTWRLK